MTEDDDTPVSELIKRKRAQGYDPEFEAFLSKRWKCPHCDHVCTIRQILIPVGEDAADHDAACPNCFTEGIKEMEIKTPELVLVKIGDIS